MRTINFAILVLMLLIGPVALTQGQPSGELVIALPNDPTGIYIANASDVTAISATRPLRASSTPAACSPAATPSIMPI